MRIFFTGGSGKAGKHAIDHLVAQGHRVTNADLTPLGRDDVPDLRIDLTDAGQVFNALSAYAEEPTGDGWGAVAVGAALALGALVVVSLMRSLLIGSPATARQVEGIRAAIEFDPDVVGIAHLRTDHLGPDELLVGAKVEFLADLSVPELAATIDRIERSIRTGIPAARIIYLEPDVADGERAAAFVAEHEGHIDLDDPRYRDVAGTDASADAVDDADIWS